MMNADEEVAAFQRTFSTAVNHIHKSIIGQNEAIEYALIASLIAVFIIVAVQLVGGKVSTVFTEVGNTLK